MLGGALIFKKSSGEYVVFDEFAKDKKDKIYYATDEKSQAFYIDLLTKQSVDVLMSDSWLDVHFIPFLESKYKDIKFVRVDSEITNESINEEELLLVFFPINLGILISLYLSTWSNYLSWRYSTSIF